MLLLPSAYPNHREKEKEDVVVSVVIVVVAAAALLVSDFFGGTVDGGSSHSLDFAAVFPQVFLKSTEVFTKVVST